MSQPITIAILSPGEMGSALAAVLLARGHRVVTALAGRSERTQERARRDGIVLLDGLEDVARQSDVVISLTPPDAALDAADRFAQAAGAVGSRALYIDANSISPETAAAMGDRLRQAGIDLLDAAVNGLARNLTTSATLFVSGARADEAARLLGDAVRVRNLGARNGVAKAMKMLLSGLSKGVCALFVETALTARQMGMLPEMMGAYESIYPGVMQLVERMLPTYAEHAARRAQEMAEMEQTVRSAGVTPLVLGAVRLLHERLAAADLAAPAGQAATAQSLIERLAEDSSPALAAELVGAANC